MYRHDMHNRCRRYNIITGADVAGICERDVAREFNNNNNTLSEVGKMRKKELFVQLATMVENIAHIA